MADLLAGLGEARAHAEAALDELEQADAPRRLFAGDGGLWSEDPERAAEVGRWLGWLPVVDEMTARAGELTAWAQEARRGRERAVLCGMGGSSLAPLVLQRAFGGPLEVLDTTDPAAVAAVPVDGSLFVIASKSGTTIEPLVMMEHFLAAAGGDGSRFVAITDPSSFLASQAEELGFHTVFTNRPDIGGRYSALSLFGLVPAALAGVPVDALLESARAARDASSPEVPARRSPALQLGAILGGLARAGRDKLTLLTSPSLGAFGLWLEQLIAESTGKEGTGVVPLADEAPGEPGVYGADRVFAHLRADATHDAVVAALQAAGQPVVVLDVPDAVALGGQMLLWELATAYAGRVLGIDPFDQPDVEAAKKLARDALQGYERDGRLPEEEPGDVVAALAAAERGRSYVAIQADVTPTPETEAALQRLRGEIRDRLGVATSMGFGPRYLHSTGQLHKGGPPTGVFLQVLADEPDDLPIPGRTYGFRTLIDAQAAGDAAALRAAGRPVARVRLRDFPGAVREASGDGL